MGQFLPIRAFNRSQQVRIGGQKVSPTATSYVDVTDSVQRKELGYHSAVGAVYVVGSLKSSDESFAVWSGCTIDQGSSGSDKILGIAAGELRLDDGTYVTVGATTSAITLDAADASKDRIDIVTIDDAGTVGKVKGTAATSPVQPDTPAGQILLAVVTRAANDDAIGNGDIADARERV